MSEYRRLSQEEITVLKNNGCLADDWGTVSVAAGFSAEAFRFVEFKGKVRIGAFSSIKSMVTFAVLENVQLLGDVVIRNIGGKICNYIIAEHAVLENVAEMRFKKNAAAAVGRKAAVVVESGGREVVMFPGLSAQTAYLSAFATGEKFRENLLKIIAVEVEKHNTCAGIIGARAEVRNAGMITDTVVMEGARIAGAAEIEDSTVGGYVGAGSILRNTIVENNGHVGAGCILESCFVANGAVIDKGFSGENSLFFSNSECLRGEGCSVFAGAYTSSHHKSTLLLAAVYSFYTAGSGSNFSNHRFKLGPVHQGIIERGSKSGSSSYLIWPSHIAPFTTIIGRHPARIDSSAFPFSLLLEQQGKSVLLPGATLFSAGFERDCAKWLKRDKRDENAVDLITPFQLNPYTVGKILNAIKILKELKGRDEDIKIGGFEIPAGYIGKALARYHAGVNYYYGGVVAEALKKHYLQNIRSVDHVVKSACVGVWKDYAGLIAPAAMLDKIIRQIEEGKLIDYTQLMVKLRKIHADYEENQWEWTLAEFGEINLSADKEELIDILRNWVEAATLRLHLVEKDAAKEFSSDLRTGYGLTGDAESDFAAVHGDLKSNAFVKEICIQTDRIYETAELLQVKITHTQI